MHGKGSIDTRGGDRNLILAGPLSACACNRYQALFSPPSGPGYEANIIYAPALQQHFLDVKIGVKDDSFFAFFSQL